MSPINAQIASAFKLVVFDWDGTVVDSTPSITTSIQEACRDIGIAVPATEEARWVIGLGLQDALSRVAPNLSIEQQSRLTERFRVVGRPARGGARGTRDPRPTCAR